MNTSHPHLRVCWTDDPTDPGRLSLDDPDAQRLIAAISPDSHATDLGGVMSLNAKLDALALVLRVHQPSVSRRRLPAQKAVRGQLADQGLVVPTTVPWTGFSATVAAGYGAHSAGQARSLKTPLYAAALDGFTEKPAENLCSRLSFLHLSA